MYYYGNTEQQPADNRSANILQCKRQYCLHRESDGESWFIAKDICCALGLQDVSMTVKRLDDDEKLIQTLFVSGQGRETWTVNESGLYGLIFLSRKPEAKAFRKWVTNEVLPSIRRTGAYSVCPTQRPTLPAPKFRPDFIEWKQAVCRYLNRNDLKTVATNMKVTYSHVCKVYSGNTMSRRIADRLTKLAISHKNKGIIYPEPVPVYRQLLIEWEEQG